MKASMKTMKMIALTLFAGAFIGCAGEGTTKQESDNEAVKTEAHEAHSEHAHYACPMDCEDGKVYDEPGQCPKCEMDLVQVSEEEAHADEATEHSDDHEHGFACPMHPEITGHEGDKCSKCGMDLTEIEPE
jgi:hypothetical protein